MASLEKLKFLLSWNSNYLDLYNSTTYFPGSSRVYMTETGFYYYSWDRAVIVLPTVSSSGRTLGVVVDRKLVKEVEQIVLNREPTRDFQYPEQLIAYNQVIVEEVLREKGLVIHPKGIRCPGGFEYDVLLELNGIALMDFVNQPVRQPFGGVQLENFKIQCRSQRYELLAAAKLSAKLIEEKIERERKDTDAEKERLDKLREHFKRLREEKYPHLRNGGSGPPPVVERPKVDLPAIPSINVGNNAMAFFGMVIPPGYEEEPVVDLNESRGCSVFKETITSPTEQDKALPNLVSVVAEKDASPVVSSTSEEIVDSSLECQVSLSEPTFGVLEEEDESPESSFVQPQESDSKDEQFVEDFRFPDEEVLNLVNLQVNAVEKIKPISTTHFRGFSKFDNSALIRIALTHGWQEDSLFPLPFVLNFSFGFCTGLTDDDLKQSIESGFISKIKKEAIVQYPGLTNDDWDKAWIFLPDKFPAFNLEVIRMLSDLYKVDADLQNVAIAPVSAIDTWFWEAEKRITDLVSSSMIRPE